MLAQQTTDTTKTPTGSDNTNNHIATDPDLAAMRALPRKPNELLSHIPGPKGLPIIGSSLNIIKDAPGFVQQLFAEHGPIFKASGFGSTSVNFCDIDAARMILLNKDKNFSSELGWARVAALLRTGILLRDFSDHRVHRRVLQQAFKRPVLENYATRLNAQLKTGVEAWPKQESFKFQTRLKSLLLDNAASLFMGAELGKESNLLNQHFVALLNATVSLSRREIPGTSWFKGRKGTRFLRNWLENQIDHRINSDEQDFFTTLLKLSQDPESEMSIEEVIDHTVLLLFAAHDTTTSTICSIVALLCEHTEWQGILREELQQITADSLSIDDFKQLPKTDQFFNEVLRHYPPIFVVLRRCIREFEYRGIKIPSNTQTNVNIHALHHHPDYWTNPHQFDPERFSAERAEHKKDMFQFLPFGGGAHKCLGINFAEIQTKILLFHLLRNYEVSTKPGRKLAFKHLPMPLPKDGLPVTIKAITR